MPQREARGAPAMPGLGHSRVKAKARLLPGTNRKRSRLSRTRQDLWEEPSWSDQRWCRSSPTPRGARARSPAGGRSEASPENAARERSRVRTLRQAFLALQAALPAVPPDTKLSKLDVLVLATSYIAHLTRTLGHELPSPAWPPFLRGLRHLHPLKVYHRPRDMAGEISAQDPEARSGPCDLVSMLEVWDALASTSPQPLPPAKE
uniref:transcription factor 23 isoform X2 n=1 Tax=Ictidomys tridecemlineatus TaxID=43179 RepID=UPI001A9EFA8D|nr:transcription factor 23 isoform X2 [Ictidomys tridecemlineatus]